MPDEPSSAAGPEQVAVGVTWSREPRARRGDLGVLLIGQGRVQLLDRDDAAVLEAAVADVAVEREGKWKVRLTAGLDDVVYISGVALQEVRSDKNRAVLERHQAVAAAPKPRSMSDRRWRSILSSQYWGTLQLNIRAQKVVWQARLVAIFTVLGARVES